MKRVNSLFLTLTPRAIRYDAMIDHPLIINSKAHFKLMQSLRRSLKRDSFRIQSSNVHLYCFPQMEILGLKTLTLTFAPTPR